MIVLFSFLLSFSAQAESCQPNYQVVNTNCKEGKVLGERTILRADVMVNNGACRPPADKLCNEHSKTDVISPYPGAKVEDVIVKGSRTENKDLSFCNDGSRKKVVYCSFEFKAPVYELVSDVSCPVKHIEDTAKCFSADKKDVDVSTETVEACLSARPSNETELWKKSLCLVDVYKAQKDLRIKTDLSIVVFNRVETQLNVIANRPKTPKELSALIIVELRR